MCIRDRGERLNDADLAKYFSVSRTPVREAIQMLNEQKLVEIVPSSGTFVAPINQEDIKHVYQLLGGLQEMCIRDRSYCLLLFGPGHLNHGPA